MSWFLKEFDSREALIQVSTRDFKTFFVDAKLYVLGDTSPKEDMGSFTDKELISIGGNGENNFNVFLLRIYGYSNIKPLTDFKEM